MVILIVLMMMIVLMLDMSDGVGGDSGGSANAASHACLSTPPHLSCMTKMMMGTMVMLMLMLMLVTFVSSVGKQLGQFRPKDRRFGCRLLKIMILVIRFMMMIQRRLKKGITLVLGRC